MTGGWIDRQEREPEQREGVTIIVWGQAWPRGVVACKWGLSEWEDVVDSIDVPFRYWMPAPDEPKP